ncbi:MAG: TIGR03663 family protein [Bacteriovoracaceae bacterium]|nr:TIGR03663 family protein [Bacteriovoracaceae bacterium]
MDHSKRWTSADVLFIFIILSIGFFLRYYQVDIRPIHHDESLHGMYSLYYLENPLINFYKYDPLLHGPMLYHTVPWFFWLFEVSKFSLRLPAVMIGTLLLVLPLFLKRFLSKGMIYFLMILLSLSPTLTYWSRFIRHDSFVLLGIFIMICGYLIPVKPLKAILLGLGLAFQFCAKENSFIHLTFILVYIFYEFIFCKFFQPTFKTIASSISQYMKDHPLASLLGVGVFITTFLHYYTAGFIYWDGALDGLYRKSIVYWFEQHHQERIPGPFSFPFLINSFFESWWLPALTLHLYVFYKRQTWVVGSIFIFSIIVSGLTHFFYDEPLIRTIASNLLKCKIPLDLYLFFPLIAHAIISTSLYIFENKRAKAFTAFLFFSSFFTYCFLGEKVPWLAIYPLLTGIIFYSFEFDRTFHWPIIPVVLLIFIHAGYTNYWANFKSPGAPENLLTQVHTTDAFENSMIEIRSQMESFEQGKGPLFLVYKGETWPTTWYLHGRREYHFHKNKLSLEDYDYILGQPNDSELNRLPLESYHKELIPLRSWWLPNYEKMTIENLWNYFLKKTPWNSSGSQQNALWIKKTTP